LSRRLRDLPDDPGDVTRGPGDAGARPCARTTTHDRERTRPMVKKEQSETGDAHTIYAMAGMAA
jgi:hypothetical protein